MPEPGVEPSCADRQTAGERRGRPGRRVPRGPARAPRFVALAGVAWVGLTLAAACTTAPSVRAYQRGWRAEREGRFADAVARYDEALAMQPSLVGAAVNRLRLRLLDESTLVAAREELAAARADAPDDPDLAALALWDALRRWPADEAALEQARGLVAIVQRAPAAPKPPAGLPPGPRVRQTDAATSDDPCAPRQVRARHAAVALALAEGKHNEARRLLGAWPAACAAPSPLARALVAEAAGDLQAARTLLEAQPLSGDDGVASTAGRARRLAWLRVGLAVALPQAATLSALPVHTEEQRAWRSVYLGRRALAEGQTAEALGHAASADKASPGLIDAALLRAVAWLQAGETRRAAELLAALSTRSEAAARWDVHHNLAVAALRSRQPERAVTALQTASRLCQGGCAGGERALATLRALGFGPAR
jgi:tetratricopeptide (TPR) repeat protein